MESFFKVLVPNFVEAWVYKWTLSRSGDDHQMEVDEENYFTGVIVNGDFL